MTNQRTRFGRRGLTVTAVGVVTLAGATATAAAQSHGGAGGTMGGWGTFGGWMFLWPLVLLAVLVLAVFWAGSRDGAAPVRTEESDRAIDTLRERYARGDLSDEEFERRRRKLQTQG